MKSSAGKIELTGFDDLFQTGGSEADGERVQEVPLTELFPFKNHPFQVRDDEAMEKMADSIAKYGVLVLSPHTPNFHTEANPISISKVHL